MAGREYPTPEQIKESFEAYKNGGREALEKVLLKRRAERAAELEKEKGQTPQNLQEK